LQNYTITLLSNTHCRLTLAYNVIGFYVQFFAVLNSSIELRNVRIIEHKISLNKAVLLRLVIRTFYGTFQSFLTYIRVYKHNRRQRYSIFYHLQDFWRNFFIKRAQYSCRLV